MWSAMITNQLNYEQMVTTLHHRLNHLPDHRRGRNTRYTIKDAALAAFAVFFTQSPSFLAYQRTMRQSKGRSNAERLFQIEQIPNDNQIRSLPDPLTPRQLYPVFVQVWATLTKAGMLEKYETLNRQLLVSLDGTTYFSSKRIHRQTCLQRCHKEETIYYHL